MKATPKSTGDGGNTPHQPHDESQKPHKLTDVQKTTLRIAYRHGHVVHGNDHEPWLSSKESWPSTCKALTRRGLLVQDYAGSIGYSLTVAGREIAEALETDAAQTGGAE